MQHIRFIILAAFMFFCCSINAQWSGPFTGEKVGSTTNGQTHESADIAHDNPFANDLPATLHPDTTIGDFRNVTEIGGGAFQPSTGETGSGTGVVDNPIGDAMWVIVLLMAALLGIRRYRCHKTKA